MLAAVPFCICAGVFEAEIGRHIDDFDASRQGHDDVLGGSMRKPTEYGIASRPVRILSFDEGRRLDEPKMREHVGKRLARMRVGREQGDFHMGMAGGKPNKIGACIAAGADNSNLDFPPSRIRRHGPYPLAFRELEAAARFRLAVFLTLDDARVAGQEAFFFQKGTKCRLVIG